MALHRGTATNRFGLAIIIDLTVPEFEPRYDGFYFM